MGKSKNLQYLLIVFFTSFIILSSYSWNNNLNLKPETYDYFAKSTKNDLNTPSSINYIPHDSIEITNDSNFTDYGFPGYGNSTHPYIIENYEIITANDTGILISQTTMHFLIRNCYVNANINGIYIYNTALNTADLVNNTCMNNDVGIFIEGSRGNKLIENRCNYNLYGITVSSAIGTLISETTCDFNTFDGISLVENTDIVNIINSECSNNGRDGISLDFAQSVYIISSTCSANGNNGIALYSAFDVLITDNIVSTNDFHGISLDRSTNADVKNCSFTNNRVDGIYVRETDSCSIFNNSVSGNRIAINIVTTDSSLITYNRVSNNELYALNLGFVSENNIMHHNNFTNNNIGSESQAIDNGKNNLWYDEETLDGNWWSDLGSDCTYKIDGKARSKDKYPLNRDLECPSPSTVNLIYILAAVSISSVVATYLFVRYITPRLKFRKKPCPSCNKIISSKSYFCDFCGSNLSEEAK